MLRRASGMSVAERNETVKTYLHASFQTGLGLATEEFTTDEMCSFVIEAMGCHGRTSFCYFLFDKIVTVHMHDTDCFFSFFCNEGTAKQIPNSCRARKPKCGQIFKKT